MSGAPMLAKSHCKHNLHNPKGMKDRECNPAGLSRRARRKEKHALRRGEQRLWRREYTS